MSLFQFGNIEIQQRLFIFGFNQNEDEAFHYNKRYFLHVSFYSNNPQIYKIGMIGLSLASSISLPLYFLTYFLIGNDCLQTYLGKIYKKAATDKIGNDFSLVPSDVLLSQGETPNYHRR